MKYNEIKYYRIKKCILFFLLPLIFGSITIFAKITPNEKDLIPLFIDDTASSNDNTDGAPYRPQDRYITNITYETTDRDIIASAECSDFTVWILPFAKAKEWSLNIFKKEITIGTALGCLPIIKNGKHTYYIITTRVFADDDLAEESKAYLPTLVEVDQVADETSLEYKYIIALSDGSLWETRQNPQTWEVGDHILFSSSYFTKMLRENEPRDAIYMYDVEAPHNDSNTKTLVRLLKSPD